MSKVAESVRKLFRADETGRYELNKSFVLNGVRYSTEGCAILCEPCDGEQNTEGRFPSPESILAEHDFDGGNWSSEPLPAPPARPFVECQSCLGSGMEHVICPHCNCKVGVGAGGDCPECDGTGKCDDDAIVILSPDNWIAVCYSWLLNQLPGLTWRTAGKNSPLLFKCDGGYGLVMPVDVVERQSVIFKELRFWK